jgi:hypothetical protein
MFLKISVTKLSGATLGIALGKVVVLLSIGLLAVIFSGL